MNKRKNDRLMYTVMAIGIVIAYIAFFYAVDCYTAYKNSMNDIRRLSESQSGKALYFGYDGSNEWLTDVFDKEEITAYFTGVTLHYDKVHGERLTMIYLNTPTKCPYRFLSGGMPDPAGKENVAVLGKKCKHLTYTRDGQDYISICGEEYRVTGYVSEENSTVVDSLTMLFWNHCGDRVKEAVDYFAGSPMDVCVVFEDGDVENWYYAHSDILDKYAYDIRLSDNYMDVYNLDYDERYMQMSCLLYAFSFIVLVIIIKYWISMHKEELIVRRIVGYERYQLLGYLGNRLCRVLISISLPCLLVQLVLDYLSGAFWGAGAGIGKIIWAVVFLVFTFILLLIYPMYRILVKDIISERKIF
ncbi:MAG: hypothetical protein K2L07_07540 [Lachnospiraceae bacterium]|nr:hypothetical protein [Lachnospiraceae bacterium]